MAKLFGCAKYIAEHWPLVKTSFENAAGAPWDSTTTTEKLGVVKDLTKTFSGRVGLIFKQLLAPEHAYYSDGGRALIKPLQDADARAKLFTSTFIDSNAPLLKQIDPRWGRGEPSQFNKQTHDLFDKYIRGKVKGNELPGELRNPFVKLKTDIKNFYDTTKTFQKGIDVDTGEKMLWDLDEDFIEPTVRKLADPNSPSVGQYGLIHMVPKEIPAKMIQQGNAEGVTGTDWLRLAVPVLARKQAFDPVLRQLRDAIPLMDGMEQNYTKSLINRIVGKKSMLQSAVDDMINQVRFAFGGEPLKFSPSGRLAIGITKRFYDGIMLYNPGMALLNLTQGLNILAKEDLMRTLKGFTNMRTDLGRMLSMEKQFLGDLDSFYYNSYEKGTVGKALEGFKHTGYKMFDSAELFNRGLGFHTALSRFMEENSIKSLEEFVAKRGTPLFTQGMLRGVEGANETQFLYGVVHQSPYLSTPFAKLFAGQFMTFPLRQTEFIMKNLRSDGGMFLARYMGYTGLASMMAYYGMGLAIGNQIGGAGTAPEALELIKQGNVKDAIWAATAGTLQATVGRFATNPQSVLHGLTPFGGLLIDTIALGLSDKDWDQRTAQWARSALMFVPAGLEMKRIMEGTITQVAQEGERHRAVGFQEGLTIPVALSQASSLLFGAPIPGVPSRFSGTLATRETIPETIKKSLGLRSREADMEDRIRKINADTSQEARANITSYAQAITQAMLYGSPTDFSTAYQAAIQSGAFTNMKSLHQAIEGAMQGQKLSDIERIKKRTPKSVKQALLGD